MRPVDSVMERRAPRGKAGIARPALRMGSCLLLGALMVLAACEDQDAKQSQDRAAHAEKVSQERLMARAPSRGATFRAVQTYQQAIPRSIAVCGQMNLTGGADEAFIPFVSIVTYPEERQEGQPEFQIEQYLAANSAEATRVYIEMLDRCRDNGGPKPGARPGAQPLPPVPGQFPSQAPQPAPSPAPPTVSQPAPTAPAPFQQAPAVAPPPIAATRPQGSATTRQNANLRANPFGGGAVVRVLPQGSVLSIYGQAPGGWYQVGEGEPWGWVHGSMLSVQ